MLSKFDTKLNSKDDSFDKFDIQENSESKPDSDYIFNLDSITSDLNLFLENNIFLEKKRLRAEKAHYEINLTTEKIFDAIDTNFLFKINSFKENNKNLIYLSKKPLFMNKIIHYPGPKRKNQNNTKRHGKTAFDNITTKVQVHYITFIINLTNDVIISIFGKNSKKNGLYFIDIDYNIKKNTTFENMEKFKTQSVKDILLISSSKKFRTKEEDYNKKIYNKLVNTSEVLDELFNMNYKSLFRIYHNNAEPIKKIIIKQKEIELSDKTKSFYTLIEKNNEEMKKLITEFTKRVYFE